MAKSDSNSNDLRQDQPECYSPASRGGLAVNVGTHSHMGPRSVTDRVDRSGVTELSGLTSDPICTADRRGEILISFGRVRRPSGVLNPFGPTARDDRASRRPDASIAFASERPCTYKGFGFVPSRKPHTRRRSRTTRYEPWVYKGVASNVCRRPADPAAVAFEPEPSRTHKGVGSNRRPRRDGGGCVVSTSAPGDGRRGRGGVRHVVRIQYEYRVDI